MRAKPETAYGEARDRRNGPDWRERLEGVRLAEVDRAVGYSNRAQDFLRSANDLLQPSSTQLVQLRATSNVEGTAPGYCEGRWGSEAGRCTNSRG